MSCKNVHSAFRVLVFLSFFALFCEEPRNTRPIVDMINTIPVSTDKIKITWKSPKNFDAESILVFRSTKPFNSASDIKNLKPAAKLPPKSLSFIDSVPDYREYYYAVLAEQKNGTICDIILPSVNATVRGVKIEKEEILPPAAHNEKTYENGMLRELPLPYLNFIEELKNEPSKLSDKVIQEGKKLASTSGTLKKQKLAPYYFDEDLISPDGGDDYHLFEILKNYFVKKDYKTSKDELLKFLSINRSEETTNRAVFYLGQANYFLGEYRDALPLFLYSEDAYPVLSKKWINSTLDFYKIPEKQQN